MTPDRLLRLRDVSQDVGFSPARIYELIAAGAFPKPIKFGASSRWLHSEVQDWIQQQKARRDREAEMRQSA